MRHVTQRTRNETQPRPQKQIAHSSLLLSNDVGLLIHRPSLYVPRYPLLLRDLTTAKG